MVAAPLRKELGRDHNAGVARLYSIARDPSKRRERIPDPLDKWREVDKHMWQLAASCAHAHAPNLLVIMHSRGKVTNIIPDGIEGGIDVLQFDQPRIRGIETLAEIQRGTRVTFWCPVDIQTSSCAEGERGYTTHNRNLRFGV
jgi:hypothetical protein